MPFVREAILSDKEFIIKLLNTESENGHFLKCDHNIMVEWAINGIAIAPNVDYIKSIPGSNDVEYSINGTPMIKRNIDHAWQSSVTVNAGTHIIEDDMHKRCGFVILRNADDHVEIYNLAIEKECRRKGYASLLIRGVENFAKTLHKPVKCRCYFKSTWMISLLEKSGYNEIKRGARSITYEKSVP